MLANGLTLTTECKTHKILVVLMYVPTLVLTDGFDDSD